MPMLLDTDVLIDIERNFAPALAWIATLNEPPSVSGFAALELAHGAANKMQLQRTRAFLADFPLLWPTAEDMLRAFEEYADLRLSHNLGLLDSLIAATAIGSGEILATFNLKHYRAVPGLRTVQPYKR
jgi:predicted nucleic acid-binding protein